MGRTIFLFAWVGIWYDGLFSIGCAVGGVLRCLDKGKLLAGEC